MRPALAGRTVVCIAGGPSLTREDVDYACSTDCFVFGVNDAYRLTSRLDALYAADYSWWRHHWPDVKDYPSPLVTLNHNQKEKEKFTANNPGIELLYFESEEGGDMSRPILNRGDNGGFQVMHLAVLWGAARLVLLGYDMSRPPKDAEGNRRRHWFGEHPPQLFKDSNYSKMRSIMDKCNCPIPVVNCSPRTALTCFPRSELRQTI